MSTLAIWCRVVHSRDVSPYIFDGPAMSGLAFSVPPFENYRRTALQYPVYIGPLCRCQQYGAFSMKALARYRIILLGEQRHIRCEQPAQGCCLNNAAVGVEPAIS